MSPQPRLKFTVSISPDATDEELLFARQLGIPTAYCWVRDDQSNAAALKALRARIEDAGLQLYMAGNYRIAKSHHIHLATDQRQKMIDEYKALIEALGEAGIPVTTFTWEPDKVWSSAQRSTSRDASARHVDLAELKGRGLTHERIYSEQEIWDNFAYFMDQIIPVAESAEVRMALHPNDPPTDALGGVPCLIRSAETYRRAFAIADSPYLGMEFCCGCWLEGGAAFGDLLAGLAEFVPQDKVLITHFRNVTAPLPVFTETFLDNGYMDMYQIMRELVAQGYAGTVTLDHTPQFAGAYGQGSGTAYAIGYMRALLERACDELGFERPQA